MKRPAPHCGRSPKGNPRKLHLHQKHKAEALSRARAATPALASHPTPDEPSSQDVEGAQAAHTHRLAVSSGPNPAGPQAAQVRGGTGRGKGTQHRRACSTA